MLGLALWQWFTGVVGVLLFWRFGRSPKDLYELLQLHMRTRNPKDPWIIRVSGDLVMWVAWPLIMLSAWGGIFWACTFEMIWLSLVIITAWVGSGLLASRLEGSRSAPMAK